MADIKLVIPGEPKHQQRHLTDMQVGKAGEYFVCFDLISKGYTAYLSEQALPYDVVLDVSGFLIKIQVKTISKPHFHTSKSGNSVPTYPFQTKLRGKNGKKRYNVKNSDIFALVVLSEKRVAYITVKDAANQTVHLRSQSYKEKYFDEICVNKTKKILSLRDEGATYSEISSSLNTNVGGVWNICNGKRGSKRKDRKYIEELTITSALERLSNEHNRT